MKILFFVFGVMLVISGLRYFKLYIASIGFFIGFIVGSLLGIYISSVIGFQNPEPIIIFLALISGSSFAYISWPFRKLVVFINSGLIVFLISLIILILNRVEFQQSIIYSGVLFFLSGFIALKLYDYIIIYLTSIQGFQFIFNSLVEHKRSLDFSLIFNINYMERYFEEYLEYYIIFIFFGIIYLLFSLYGQKIIKEGKKQYFQRIVTVISSFSIISFISSEIDFTPLHPIILGISSIAWPIQILLFYIFSTKLTQFIKSKTNTRFTLLNEYLVYCLVILLIVPVIGFVFTPSIIYKLSLGKELQYYYSNWPFIKILFLFLIFPSILIIDKVINRFSNKKFKDFFTFITIKKIICTSCKTELELTLLESFSNEISCPNCNSKIIINKY